MFSKEQRNQEGQNFKTLGLGFTNVSFYRPIVRGDGFALNGEENIKLHQHYHNSRFTVEDPILIDGKANLNLWPVTVKDGKPIIEEQLIGAGLKRDSGEVVVEPSGLGKIVDAQG